MVINHEYEWMTNRELIDLESSLDYNDGELLTVIFSRAEDDFPGISQRYLDAVTCDSDEDPDAVRAQALSALASRPDSKF